MEPGKRVQIELRDVETDEKVRPTEGSAFRYDDSDLMVVFMLQADYDYWIRNRGGFRAEPIRVPLAHPVTEGDLGMIGNDREGF